MKLKILVYSLLCLLVFLSCSSGNDEITVPTTNTSEDGESDGNQNPDEENDSDEETAQAYLLTQITDNADFHQRALHSSVVFEDKIWIIGGFSNPGGGYNDVWYSEDGINWTEATSNAGFSPRYRHTSVVFDNRIWVIGGFSYDTFESKNDVWYSEDGITWTEATPNANFVYRDDHSSVVYDNRIWVMGGISSTASAGIPGLDDVWSSEDGIIWEEISSNADFGRLQSHTSIVFDNRIWVVAGAFWPDGDSRTYSSKLLWNTSDGETWSLNGEGDFPARQDHTSVIFDNKIWVIGGYPSNLRDFWFSENGDSWVKFKHDSELELLFSHTSVVFKDKVWIIGGGNLQSGYSNSIWTLERAQ